MLLSLPFLAWLASLTGMAEMQPLTVTRLVGAGGSDLAGAGDPAAGNAAHALGGEEGTKVHLRRTRFVAGRASAD
jgi:hypothetical protein